jgi:putative aldouronate transport system substrate-binding protein
MKRQDNRSFPIFSRILPAAILALLLAFCASCSENSPEQTKASVPVQISIMVPLHQTKPPADSLMRRLEELTGTRLDVQWIPEEIYTDKMLNAIETGTLRQVTFVNQADYGLVKNAIRSDMFWNIGPYLDSYPNLRKLSKSTLDETAVDGNYYGIYNERPASRQGVFIRKDWLERLGLAVPGTIDELYRVMKAFTYDDPDGDGKQDTYGLTDRNDLVYGAFKTLSSYFGTPNNWLLSGDRLIPEFATGEYMDTMNFMKKLYDESLINRDFPVTSKQVQRYSMITGKAGVYIGSMPDAVRMREEMKKVNPAADLVLVNRIKGPKGYGVWSIPEYSGLFLFSRKAVKTEEELKTILGFFNRTLDPDVSNLMKYGVEGRHYILKDGKAVVPPDMFRLMNEEVLPMLSLMAQNLSNPNLLPLSTEQQDPFMQTVNRLVADNGNILIRDPAEKLFSPTYDARWTELNSIISNATYNYILGKIDAAGFRQELEIWKQKGGSQVIRELEEAYRTRTAASAK